MHVFLVRYEYNLHINCKAIPVTGPGNLYIFPVRYEHLHIKRKAIPVPGSGGLYVFPARYDQYLHIKK
jgi:hypothetical protein